MCLAVPGEILTIDESEPLLRNARVRFGGVVREVSLAMTPDAAVGDFVMVHAGLALSVLDAAEAAATLEAIESLEAPDPPA